MQTLIALLLASSASAASLNARPTTPVLALRGGAYPPPKPGYHQLAAKGAAATKVPIVPNLLSGGLAGVYVAFGAMVSLSVAGALPGVAESNPGIQKLIFGVRAAPP